MFRVLFLHGWHSQPGGRKPLFLREQGLEVENPALCPDDFDKARATAQKAFEDYGPDLVIGSSRGGALAMNIESRRTPLILMCPAWKNWGSSSRIPSSTIVIHSPHDQVVPFAHSEELVQSSGLPGDQLWSVGKDHRLADQEALEAMLRACHSWS